MLIREDELQCPPLEDNTTLLRHLSQVSALRVPKGLVPVRFVVSESSAAGYM